MLPLKFVQARAGSQARHSSTGPANHLYDMLYPGEAEPFVQWEPFQRSEAAFRRTVAESQVCQEVYAICKEMSSQFGHGVGRILLRSLGDVLGPDKAVGERARAAADTCWLLSGIERLRLEGWPGPCPMADSIVSSSFWALSSHPPNCRQFGSEHGIL